MSPHGSSSRTQLGLAKVHVKWTPSPKTHPGRRPKATRGCRETPSGVGELMCPPLTTHPQAKSSFSAVQRKQAGLGEHSEPPGSRSISPVLTFPLPCLEGCWGNPPCSSAWAAILAPSPCPGSCSSGRFPWALHRTSQLFSDWNLWRSVQEAALELPALCKLSCNVAGAQLDCVSLYPPLWHTHTHRMCLASEAADAGFIPSLVASDWHKCWELLVENCLWALGLFQTPLKTKERLVIALELALDRSHYLCPESSVQTKQPGLGHCEPVPGGPSHLRKREAGRCIWAFLKTSSQGPPRRGLALGTWSQPSLVGGDALLRSRHPDFCAQD